VTAQRGSAALTAVLSGLVVTVLGLSLVTAAVDLWVAAARAQTAADAAALGAMGTSPLTTGGTEPRPVASRLTDANGGRLDRTELTSWPYAVAVEVSVQPASAAVQALKPRVRRRAVAAITPPGTRAGTRADSGGTATSDSRPSQPTSPTEGETSAAPNR
jgi:hypothetical protein